MDDQQAADNGNFNPVVYSGKPSPLKLLSNKKVILACMFVLLFGAVGAFLHFKGFAATTVGMLEAESLTGSGQVTKIADASNGSALTLASSVPASGALSFTDSATTLTVRAKGVQCHGAPQIVLAVDGKQLLTANVSVTTWTTYSSAVSLASGNHTLTATFANPKQKGNCSRSVTLDVISAVNNNTTPTTTDSTPPTIALTSPVNNATVSGTVNVSATASDDIGVKSVAMYVDNTLISTVSASPYNFSWDTTLYSNTSHVVKLVATDAAGNSSSVNGTFNVSNSTPPPTSSNPLAISVSGNRLVDANGNTVQLRGVNRSGTQYACIEGWGFFDGPTDATALSAIKGWGANTVRVSLNEDCWLGINGAPTAYSGAAYQTTIKDYVGRLNAQGLRVILDLHWNGPGTTKATDQLAMADRDHAPAFWAGVAGAFKDNPSVLFDLYNEPHPDSNRNTTAAWVCIRDGGTCPGVTFTAAGSQEMLNAVRNAGATNVVMVGGPQYAGMVDQWTTYKPTDKLNQLAASIHIYYNTPSSPEWAPCDYQSCWNNTMAPLASTTPIVMGEVGEHDCSINLINGTALSPTQPSLLDWADQHGVSYMGWSWLAKGGANCAGEPSLVMDYSGTPTAYGAGIRNHLLSLPH